MVGGVLSMAKSNLGYEVLAWKSHSLATMSQGSAGSAVETTLQRARTTQDIGVIEKKEAIQVHLDESRS